MENIIPVLGKSKTEIERQTKKAIQENTPVTTQNATATSNAFAEMVSEREGGVYNTMADLMRSAYLSTAVGVGLDRIADLFSVTRTSAQRAQAIGLDTFKFYVDLNTNESVSALLASVPAATKNAYPETFPNGSAATSFVIKAGVTVSSTDGKSYVTTDDVTISDTEVEGFSGVSAIGVGDFFNVGKGDLKQHDVSQYQPELGAIIDYIQCTNIQSIGTGAEVETDENLRFRIAQKAISSANANMTSVREAALNVPGISDVIVQPRLYGNGTTGLIIQTVNPVTDDGTLKAVQSSVDIIKSVSEKFYVSAPEYLGVTFAIDLSYYPNAKKTDLETKATETIVDYINNLGLGGEFIINEMIQRVMDLDDNIRDMVLKGMGYGLYNRYTGLLEDYTPLKIANQRCEWDQKWYTNGTFCVVCEEGRRA